MAEAKKREGKKKKKPKKPSEKWKMYKIVGNKIERERSCPRCGVGVFLAKSKNRLHCGKCHYTEFLNK